MMDADEARRRGLGAPRGLLVVFLFWFVVGGAAMLVLSACQANDADMTERVTTGVSPTDRPQAFRDAAERSDTGLDMSLVDDATINSVCGFIADDLRQNGVTYDRLSFHAAMAVESGFENDQAIGVVLSCVFAYAPELVDDVVRVVDAETDETDYSY